MMDALANGYERPDEVISVGLKEGSAGIKESKF